MKTAAIDVGAIEEVDRSRLGNEDVEDSNVRVLRIGDPDEHRDVALQVQQGMQLDTRDPSG